MSTFFKYFRVNFAKLNQNQGIKNIKEFVSPFFSAHKNKREEKNYVEQNRKLK